MGCIRVYISMWTMTVVYNLYTWGIQNILQTVSDELRRRIMVEFNVFSMLVIFRCSDSTNMQGTATCGHFND